MTKTQLKAERLKPALGQRPASRYWQGLGWVYQYDASEAVTMLPYRAPTEAQRAALAAGRALVGTAACTGCGERTDKCDLDRGGRCFCCVSKEARERTEQEWRDVCECAAHWLALDPLFLDTETTGLDDDAEIVEIAVLDRHGIVLFETLVKPIKPVPDVAIAIHGITNEELTHAPAWSQVAASVADLIQGRVIIAHNAVFDERMLKQSCQRHELPVPVVHMWGCTLDLLTNVNHGRWPSLSTAINLAGAPWPEQSTGRPHRAAYDAHSCRNILLALEGAARQLENDLGNAVDSDRTGS